MKILILGGTGTMGGQLVRILGNTDCEVLVTSRKTRISVYDNVRYIAGNAHDMFFLREILREKVDVIIDFMSYNSEEFAARKELLLEATGQYMFLSSARVYADDLKPLRESSDRLLDVCGDRKFLASDEYALAKARQEDMLRKSGRKNWTIIRPYITYSDIRLQLGIYEKELWLYRILKGRTVLFSRNIGSRRTTMTYAGDVARAISKLIGNPSAFGETVHITQPESMTWDEVWSVYAEVLKEKTGIAPRMRYTDNAEMIGKITGRIWQTRYDRLYDRTFDNTKISRICGQEGVYMPMREGLKKSLEEFLDGGREFRAENADWKYQGYADRVCHENTFLYEIPGTRNKLKYLIFRYFPYLGIGVSYFFSMCRKTVYGC